MRCAQHAILAVLPALVAACASAPQAGAGRGDAPRRTDAAAVARWADVVEQRPDPATVTDVALRSTIEATGLPWRVRDRASGVEMLLVPAGSFVMGKSPGDNQAFASELPAHQVALTAPFYLGRFEITQEEWTRVMGRNPSRFQESRDREHEIARLMQEGKTRQEAESQTAPATGTLVTARLPVDGLNWADAAQFCRKTGLRLPTEAEWEFACRAGIREARYGALDTVAWHAGNAQGRPHEVGTKTPNALGFHDMLGNIWEWCADWYDGDAYAARELGIADPLGPDDGDFRVLRGGSWDHDASLVRSSHRGDVTPEYANSSFGMRVARDP
jgi:formylglycine-generating enzyme required for sulfatase activity